MKKIITVLLLLLVAAVTKADGLDRLASRFKEKEGALYMASIEEIDKLEKAGYFKVRKKRCEDKEDAVNRFVEKLNDKGVKDARALILDDCTCDVKQRFMKKIDDAIPGSYESFIRLGGDDGNFRVYVKKMDESVKLLCIITGNARCGFFEIESDNSLLNSMLNFD